MEIREEPAALSDHHKKATTAVFVMARITEVLREVLDPLSEERDLDLRRTGVLLVLAVRRDDLTFYRGLSERHPLSFP